MTYLVAGEGSATITTGTNSVTIQLTDLFVNPGDVGDNLSALLFTLSNTPTGASITSSSGTEITVNGNGSSTLGSTVATGWVLSLLGAQTTLDVLSGTGHAGPAHTIIGAPGVGGYTNANSSIAGSGPHNPFLDLTATFTLTEMGVTSSTTVTAATFQFGTTDGSGLVPGVLTPEPASLLLFGGAALFSLVLRKRFTA